MTQDVWWDLEYGMGGDIICTEGRVPGSYAEQELFKIAVQAIEALRALQKARTSSYCRSEVSTGLPTVTGNT
jgi:hypothetical protein